MNKKLLMLAPALLALLASSCGGAPTTTETSKSESLSDSSSAPVSSESISTSSVEISSSSSEEESSENSSVEDSSSEESEASSNVESEESSSSESIEESSSSSSEKESIKEQLKAYLTELINVVKQNPNSYIPDTLKNDYEDNLVTKDAVTYDLSTATNVSNIKYGGFGEQWNMVMDNIKESRRFYTILNTIEASAITPSVTLLKNKIEQNDEPNEKVDETGFKATISYDQGKSLKYTLQLKSGFSNSFFGDITPQLDMDYDIKNKEKTVRLQLTTTNVLKYVVGESKYEFGIRYGVEIGSRFAYFSIEKDEEENVEGHIYEFVQYKDKELMPAAADFYITDEYASVVGNKAHGITGFDGYINELYSVETGKLLGYEVKETKTVSSKAVTFNTLWFNLSDISGVNNIKYIDSDHVDGDHEEGFYLNGSDAKFEAKTVGGISLKTLSRRYDIELRKQYFYGEGEEGIEEYETNIPMMFVQQEQLSTFNSDVTSKNSSLNLNITLNQTYIDKIMSDYDTLIDVFITNKASTTKDTIIDFIGEAEVVE